MDDIQQLILDKLNKMDNSINSLSQDISTIKVKQQELITRLDNKDKNCEEHTDKLEKIDTSSCTLNNSFTVLSAEFNLLKKIVWGLVLTLAPLILSAIGWLFYQWIVTGHNAAEVASIMLSYFVC